MSFHDPLQQLISICTAFFASVRNLCPHTTYTFSVSAYNINGESPESSRLVGQTTGNAIGAPSGLKADPRDTTSVSLTWQPPGGSKQPKSLTVWAVMILSPLLVCDVFC